MGIDPEEVLFDDEKEITEDIGDKKTDDDSEIDTFDDVIVPEEVLFDDEKDNKIPETIDTVDNDVEDLEDQLFEDEKIDEMDDKQIDDDSEIDTFDDVIDPEEVLFDD